jgi:hypothetical protein
LWPAMGEFCKLGQNLGCKSCSMLLLLLLALHHFLVWKEVSFEDHNWPAAWPYFSHTIA